AMELFNLTPRTWQFDAPTPRSSFIESNWSGFVAQIALAKMKVLLQHHQLRQLNNDETPAAVAFQNYPALGWCNGNFIPVGHDPRRRGDQQHACADAGPQPSHSKP